MHKIDNIFNKTEYFKKRKINSKICRIFKHLKIEVNQLNN